MGDTGAAANGRPASVKLAKDDNSGYASGEWKSDDGRLSCGYSTFIGKRLSMEDFYDIKTSKVEGQSVWLFGIFDGHGGSRAAEFLKGNLFDNMLKHPEFIANTKLAISETYQQTDMDFLESERETKRDDGSTASAAVLFGNHLYVANVGDSRTIICKAGKAIALSEDHKPNRSDERKRIESAGGRIAWAGTWRVSGILAMTRAFGNRMLKRYVVAEPEIQDTEINEDLEYLVLASDGLWDVMDNEEAVHLVMEEEEPEVAARKLTEAAFSRGSSDNITCIVVKFHHTKTHPENHHIDADLKNRQTDADPENDSMKVDPESDPMKAYPENHHIVADLENRQIDVDTQNDPMKADPASDPMKAYPENDPLKADPETMKVYPDNDQMKAYPMNQPMKADSENDPVKAYAENDPLKANRENHPMKADPENS